MPIEIIMPKVDMDMTSGTIGTWHIHEGQSIQKGEALFDIETDKSTMEVESPASGHLHFVSATSGDIVEIGKCIGWIFTQGEVVENPSLNRNLPSESHPTGQKPPNKTNNSTQTPQPSTIKSHTVRATPLARRIAKLNGIDITRISGSGPHGRITKSDVENTPPLLPAPVTDSSVVSTAQLDTLSQLDTLGIAYETIATNRMRQTIAARLTKSTTTIPHFYLEMDCQLDALLAFRKQANTYLNATDRRKISINDILVQACAKALKTVPEANASWAGDQIIRYKDANISVAVSLEGGVITPVVRQAQNKSLNKISKEIADLVDRARSEKLKPYEYQGGSFSISNLGMFGVKAFSAIINPPESMILAVGKAERRFVEDTHGKPVGATVLSVTLSCDHRVVDGALGAKWLAEFKRFVENPVLLNMDLE